MWRGREEALGFQLRVILDFLSGHGLSVLFLSSLALLSSSCFAHDLSDSDRSQPTVSAPSILGFCFALRCFALICRTLLTRCIPCQQKAADLYAPDAAVSWPGSRAQSVRAAAAASASSAIAAKCVTPAPGITATVCAERPAAVPVLVLVLLCTAFVRLLHRATDPARPRASAASARQPHRTWPPHIPSHSQSTALARLALRFRP